MFSIFLIDHANVDLKKQYFQIKMLGIHSWDLLLLTLK